MSLPILRSQEEQELVEGVEKGGQGGKKDIRRLSHHTPRLRGFKYKRLNISVLVIAERRGSV